MGWIATATALEALNWGKRDMNCKKRKRDDIIRNMYDGVGVGVAVGGAVGVAVGVAVRVADAVGDTVGSVEGLGVAIGPGMT